MALVYSACFGCSTGPDAEGARTEPSATAPSLSIQNEFDQLCEAFRQGDNAYYGRSQVAELRGYLTQPVEAALPRAVVRARLGMELLRLGENTGAVELLGQARQIAEDPSIAAELRLDIQRKLGLAWLRQGEQANCVARHGPAACILPLEGDGIHRDPSGSRGAIKAYKAYLAGGGRDPAVIWLLNVAAMTVGGHPKEVPKPYRVAASRFRSDYDVGRFVDVASSTGLSVSQASGGGIMDDFDGDGFHDVVTSTIDPCRGMTLHRGTAGGRFEDHSQASGLSQQYGALNIIHADYDNDGDLDLLALRGGWFGRQGRMRNSLLRNDGQGNFADVTSEAGLANPAYPTQTAAWADYDNDGDLDLYIGNEADLDIFATVGTTAESSQRAQVYPSQLFRNNGDGTFVDVAAAAGVTNQRFTKGVAWGDYDNDGDPDLYVSNIGPNRLYQNNGDGTFSDVAESAGTMEPTGRSFATWFFDYDNDGQLDLFVAAYSAPLGDIASNLLGQQVAAGHPVLYRNLGAGKFKDVSRDVGLVEPSLPMGANFGDLDNDGFLDFYLGTGTPSFESLAPNLMYRNDRGRRFQDVTYSGGFGHLQKGHGVAFGDVDNDGDQDVFEQMGGAYPGDAYPSVLYLNPGHGQRWITLKLEGRQTNRSALGARVSIRVESASGQEVFHRTVSSGGSFGGSTLQLEIGLGQARRIVAIDVTWPASRQQQNFSEVPLDQAYRLVEGDPQLKPLGQRQVALGKPPSGQ